MKRRYLVAEMSEVINGLDERVSKTTTLTPIEALQIQDLLVSARKEILDMGKIVDNEPSSQEQNDMKIQVQAEIAKKLASLGVKKSTT